MARYGAIEAGGTKFVCAVGASPHDLSAQTRIPTTTPAETLAKCLEFFGAQVPIDALGVGCFGPLELRPSAPLYGHITTTPKPGWSNTDIVGPLREALAVPIRFDTDVNAALLGEARWGAAQGLSSAVYVTIGTGIGGGALIDGRLAHGLVHPEMGHLLVPREADDVAFEGVCPFHGSCAREALGAARGKPACGPSRLGSRSALHRFGPHHVGARALARAHHPGRRSDAGRRFVSASAQAPLALTRRLR